jgi:hypothetical protein
VDGTIDCLVLRCKERLDLFVGFIDCPSSAGFLVRLPAEAQRRLGKALLVPIRVRRTAHRELPQRLSKAEDGKCIATLKLSDWVACARIVSLFGSTPLKVNTE